MGVAAFFGGKKTNRFIALLQEQASLTVKGIAKLEECVKSPDEEAIESLRKLEYAADEVRRILIDELHKTFVTPLDREDIFNLSLNIDEMIDYALSTMEEMVLLNVANDAPLEAMVSLIRQAAEELEYAMQRLQENPRVAGDHARRARKFENEVEQVYRQAVADLFSSAGDVEAVLGLLRRREVYRHLSNMADRASHAADVLGMIVMKAA